MARPTNKELREMLSKATAVEWRARLLVADGIVITRDAWEITTPDYDIVTDNPRSAPIRKEADATIIVAAVNSLAELLDENGAMLRILGKIVDSGLLCDPGCCSLDCACDEARAVVEKSR